MPKPVPYREFKKRIKNLGLVENASRGKGSERLIVDPRSGISISIRCHGAGDEVKVGTISAVLRRFNLTHQDWNKAKKK